MFSLILYVFFEVMVYEISCVYQYHPVQASSLQGGVTRENIHKFFDLVCIVLLFLISDLFLVLAHDRFVGSFFLAILSSYWQDFRKLGFENLQKRIYFKYL